MKLDKKKVFEICNTILNSADLDTITEKKVRRQVEEELGLEDKILDNDPYKSIIKEFVNKILNDLQQKSDSSCSPPPPRASQPKKTNSRTKTTTKLTSINNKQRKTEIKSKNSNKVLDDDDDDLSHSKPIDSKARNKVSKQESSKNQADKARNKIFKTYGESKMVSSSSKPINREKESRTMEDTSKINDNKSSSSSRPAKSDVTTKKTEIPSEEESESASSIKRTSKSVEVNNNNKEKQKHNVSRSRVKRRINASSDTDDDKSNVKSDSAPVSTTKGSDLEESVLTPPKRSKQIKIDTPSDKDEEPSSKMRVKEKADEKQSRQKIEPVEDGGMVMALENEVLAQDSDMIGSKSGDDVETDNTIKEDDDKVLERTSEPEGNDHTFRGNSELVGETNQKLKGLTMSTIRTLDFKDEDDDDDLSSLEDDDKPRKKKRKTEKAPTKPVNKSVNDKLVNDKSVSDKTTANEKRIKSLKSLINKCGVRKNWSKLLADCNTDSKKIKKLKTILEDLGVEGRPTLEKCKKVKKNLELQAELGAMDVDNIISDDIKETRKARASRGIFNPVRRRISRVTQSSPEYDDSSSKDIQSDSE